MIAPTPDPKYARIPLADQVAAAKDILAHRYRSCSTRARTGQMTQADADREIATARAIRNTLEFVARHQDVIRAVVEAKFQREADLAKIDEIRREPAVGAVLAAFPDADVGLPRAPTSNGAATAAATAHDTPIDPDTQPQHEDAA